MNINVILWAALGIGCLFFMSLVTHSNQSAPSILVGYVFILGILSTILSFHRAIESRTKRNPPDIFLPEQ